MILLSPRLAAVADYIPPGEVLADVGTDHAYLPAALLQAGRIPRAIAGDILPGPLEAARATVAEAGLQDRIDLRMGNGLQILQPGEAATASICGMGGPLIAEILAAGPLEGIRRLALQPMAGEERLREWLVGSGWRIVDEQLVEDGGRIYVVMAAERGAMALNEAETALGPHLLRKGGPLLVRYAGLLLRRGREAREGAGRSSRPEVQERVQELDGRIRLLEEVIGRANSQRGEDR